MASDYLKEYRRLTTPLHHQSLLEGPGMSPDGASGGNGEGYMGGQADLTPLKNKAREASEALNDAQKAADSGRAEDAQEALRRARAAIDAALGGHLGPNGSATPPPTGGKSGYSGY